MEPQLRKTSAFRLLGRNIELDFADKDIVTKIAEFNDSFVDGETEAIIAASNNEIKGLLQVNDFGTQTREQASGLTYWRAVTAAADAESERFAVRDVKASFWAVFPMEALNANAMANVRAKVMPEWLEKNGYVQAPGVEIAAVHPGELAEASFWVPVRAKM